MSFRGLQSIRGVPGYVQRQLTARPIILLYHRIVELPNDPQLLCVSPQHFAEHLEVLKKKYRPVRLQDLTRALQRNQLSRRAVLITFDDGYVDNLTNARPLLERYDSPATTFITTGSMDRENEFWWDELDRLVLQPGELPGSLSLKVNGQLYHWELDGAACYRKEDHAQHANWHIEELNDPGARQRLYRALYQLLHDVAQGERQRVLDELRTWASAASVIRPTHRTLARDEVARLAENDLVEVGAHTVTHPILGSLTIAEQCAEVQRSKADLQTILNRPVESFAYPHGSYTAETLTVVREAGFSCACSSDTDIVHRGADRFRLPRVVPRNWDGDEFARWLSGWIGG